MGGSVEILIKLHWINGWFLWLFALPCAIVDGIEHKMSWRSPLALELQAGEHEVAVGFRYRCTKPCLGRLPAVVQVESGQRLVLQARNGALNSDPFMIYTTNASP